MAATSKSILTVSTVAFALMFGGGAYVLMNLSTLAKPITEKLATAALGVNVSIGSMDVRLQEKAVSVGDIRIANPAGFSGGDAIRIGMVDVVLSSVAQDLVNFEGIVIRNTDVNLEVKPDGTNLHALQKGIPQASSAAASSDAQPLKVIVQRFVMSDAKLNPKVTLITEQDLQPVVVPDVVLTGIGQKENGVLAGEAIQQIAKPVIDAAAKAANGAGFYSGLSPDALKDMGINQINSITDQVKDGVNAIGDTLKNLF